MWRLTSLGLKNRLVTIIIALIIAGTSIWALTGLKVELIPDIEFPFLSIVTVYPDADPETVVKDVTSPIEKSIWDRWSNNGLRQITSTSSSGFSFIMGEFEFGTDMTRVIETIKADLKEIAFPAAVTNYPKLRGDNAPNPQIIPINMNMIPLVVLSVTGEMPVDQLKSIADSQILPGLQQVTGVLRVDTEGGQADQIIIAPDPALMNLYGVSMSQIAASLAPAYDSLEKMAGTQLGVPGVFLKDVATVTKSPPPLSTITRTNGQPSVGIAITKTDVANTVETARAIKSELARIQTQLPVGVNVVSVFDQSEYITASINSLWEKAIVGGVLAIIIVFIFLMAVRASLITAISIPLSVLICFLGMKAAGVTINLLTLSAISIAVGRLIDDSIVMVEVIFRRRKMGQGFREAALGGAREVANPITTATIATVAIFVPLLFVGGLVGEMFLPFALTVTFAMLGSLLVALFVVPALSQYLISRQTPVKEPKDNWYQKFYVGSLKWTLAHRALVIILSVILLVGSLGLIPLVGTSFMAGMGEKMIEVDIQMPPKTDIVTTSAAAAKIEALLAGNEFVENFYTSVGTGTSMQGIMAAIAGGGSNTASIEIYLKQNADVKKEVAALDEAIQKLGLNASVEVSEGNAEGGMGIGGAGVSLHVQGKDQDNVTRVAGELVEKLKEIPGLSDISSDLTTVVPKLSIVPDLSKALSAGLSFEQMAQMQQEFYLMLFGGTLPNSQFQSGDAVYSVYLKGVSQDLVGVEEARALRIGFPRSVALGDVANISVQSIPSHISHTDTTLSASIQANITEKNVGAVNAAIQKAISALPATPGVEVKAGGIAEQMQETFSNMGIAIVVAIFIVFLIVILMMRSVLNPVIIMVSLPLAVIGAFMGLALTGYTLSASAMMGLLMLVGIVLTNAIVLITLVEELRRSGKSVSEALIEGGKTRLRPIMMTALTTIIAMVPMAVGWGPASMLAAE
ncbi:MAG TPA: efflux RND transporter permease subunit, partial [Dehalococcoidales bacterium]|nr:efflux RND transporter permease subunit [Dehalococcoidales bacterium]